MRMRGAIVLMSVLSGILPAVAESLSLEAVRDATLIEDPAGALANGAGPALFVGRTGQSENGIRRALVWFDVAGALPRGAIVEDVVLRMFVTPSNPEPRVIGLHRVLADWGEGPSEASGGSGATALPGDVTWLHTFWDDRFWVRAGGQFVARASAALLVGGASSYAWTGGPHLIQDVALWNAAPDRNFGWILIGDESARQTSKSFASREHPDPALRPVLEITYRLAGYPPQ